MAKSVLAFAWVSTAIICLSCCGSKEPDVYEENDSMLDSPAMAEGEATSDPIPSTPPAQPEPTPDVASPEGPTEFPAPIDTSANPPVPAFAGENQPDDAVAPEEEQRCLEQYGADGLAARLKVLRTSAYPKMREQVAASLEYIYREEGAIDGIRTALLDSKAAVRLAALDAADGHGFRDKIAQAVPELVTFLKTPDSEEAKHAFRALGSAGVDAGPAAPHLLWVLQRGDNPENMDACRTLAAMGESAKPAKEMLNYIMVNGLFGDDDAAIALGKMGAEDLLLKAGNGPDSSVQGDAANGMSHLPSISPAATETLIRLLSSDNSSTRYLATRAICKVNPMTDEIINALKPLVDDKETLVREFMAQGLGDAEPKLDSALELLQKLANDSKSDISSAAQNAIAQFPGADDLLVTNIIDTAKRDGNIDVGNANDMVKTVPALLDVVENSERGPGDRSIAWMVCQKVIYAADDEIKKRYEKLNSELSSEEQPLDLRVATAIRKPDQIESAQLHELLTKGINGAEFRGLQLECITAAGKNGVKASVPQLISALEKSQPDGGNNKLESTLASYCLTALARIGPDATDAVPAIIKSFDKLAAWEQLGVISALGKIGTNPSETIPFIELQLSSQASHMKKTAALALAQIVGNNSGTDPARAIQAMSEVIKEDGLDPDRTPKFCAALKEMAKPMVLQLAEFLESEEAYEQGCAAECLAEIGMEAGDAMPALILAASNGSPRREVFNAIGKIKTGGKEFAKKAPELLKDLEIRKDVLRSLASLGDKAAAAIDDVAKVLESEDELEKQLACEAIGAMGKAGQKAAKQLRDLLAETGYRPAAFALLQLFPEHENAIAFSLDHLDYIHESEAAKLVNALGNKIQPIIAAAEKHSDTDIQAAAKYFKDALAE